MNDLISRQAAIDALIELYEYQRDIDPTEAADLVRQGIYLAEKKIEQLPSAQPFNKGLWVKQELAPQTLLFCSLCGCKKPQGVAGNFCPNCGADMRGEEDGRSDK